MSMLSKIIIFLVLNFAALLLGGLFTSSGVSSEWYNSLDKAPWTPPGWVFGTAWTTIMICFAFYMAIIWDKVENKKKLIGFFTFQWILNVLWNPIFFSSNAIFPGLIIITALTIVIGIITYSYFKKAGMASLLLIPYVLWLLIATSLNLYIYVNN